MFLVFKITFIQVIISGFQENYATLIDKLAAQGIECEFIEGSIVTEADLDAFADPNGGQTLLIIDDNSIAAASSKEVAQVFTMARHKNCSIVLLLHFIFGHWPSSRIISANTAYFFLLKSPRMAKQVSTLGSQINKQRLLVSAYEREMRKPYGYVLVDLCTNTPEHLRISTNFFDKLWLPDAIKTIEPIPLKTELVTDKKEEPKKNLIKPTKPKVAKLDESILDEEEEEDEESIKSANSNDEYDIDDDVDDYESDDSEKSIRQEDTSEYKRYMALLKSRGFGEKSFYI